MNGDPEVYVLLTLDPATGVATHPVGAVGLVEGRHYLSWVPLDPAADSWRERLNPTAGAASVRDRVAYWLEHANGITLDIQPIDPHASDLPGAVEAAVDQLLTLPDAHSAAATGHRRR